MAVLSLENEQWERVPGYEEFYEVSDRGRVKSRFRYARSGAGMRRVAEKLMTQTVHPQTGHCRVQLSKRGKTKTHVVYKLVLEVHGGLLRPPKHDVKHVDGNRENNCLENLSWVPEEPKNLGVAHGKATLNSNDIQEIRMLRAAGMSVGQIATKLQVSKGQVSKVAAGKLRQHI
jgi:hypothetical protein